MTTKQIRNLNWRSLFSRWFLNTAGALISAFGVMLFLAPTNIAAGGVSGIAIILHELIITPVGLIVLLGNIPIQIIGYRMLGGWRVVGWTAYHVVVYSAAVDLLATRFDVPSISDNVLLMALFGGILWGIGGGLVYRSGATGGGTSTLARIVQLKFGFPMSTTSLYTDGAIIAAAGVVFGWEAALYAIVTLWVTGAVTDYVLEGPSVIRTATIITDRPDEISRAILQDLHRGVTAWQGEGMFTEQPHTVLFVTISRPQVNQLRETVFTADPNAFVVIGQGHMAYGEGFKQRRRQRAAALPMQSEQNEMHFQ